MSDDIVTRLREYSTTHWPCIYVDTQEAADEIERLRDELVNVRDLLDHTYQELRKYYDADEAVRGD